jgi:hypothetical protein
LTESAAPGEGFYGNFNPTITWHDIINDIITPHCPGGDSKQPLGREEKADETGGEVWSNFPGGNAGDAG